jgi:hypothetical protein
VLAHIEKLTSEMGAAEPQVLAHQLALLIDGAIVAAMVSRDPCVADTAALAAGSLFGPSKLKKARRAADAASFPRHACTTRLRFPAPANLPVVKHSERSGETS